MAIKDILIFPDPQLREISKEVTEFDASLKSLTKDLFETMENSGGIGLAAIQVGIPLRVAVIKVDEPFTIVNPKVEPLSPETLPQEEGCLSLPGVRGEVARPKSIRVSAQDITGKPFSIQAEDLLGICLQHEIDHMDGKLFIDRVSPLKRASLNAELRNLIALHRDQTAN